MGLKSKITFSVLFLVVAMDLTAQQGQFILIKAGKYIIGKKGYVANPQREVFIKSFYLAATETTNKEFDSFIKATSYKTDAEHFHNAKVFEPGSMEFRWIDDSTAYWRFPNGTSRGGIEDKMNHPVTCISYADIQAYCKWAKLRLPSLEEWEIACRAGSSSDYFFGNDRSQIKKYANVWYGHDHMQADSSDGYMYTAPVASFAPNPWGLYDMYGNVFEFCTGKLKTSESKMIAHARGGSWWCSKNACNYFNSYDIGRVQVHASFSNQGFRVAKSVSSRQSAVGSQSSNL